MTASDPGVLQLRTPEGIGFSLTLATPLTRFLAWGVDFSCILAATAVVRQLLQIAGSLNRGLSEAGMVIAFFSISIGYGMLSEWYWHGQTAGKRLLRLRVIDQEGLHLHFSQVVVRNLLRVIDAMPGLYLVGGAVCLFSKKSQRLGDIAGGTIVIRQPRLIQPDLNQLAGSKYNSLLPYRHLAARLRQRISPSAAAVALEALVRRDELDATARLRLFSEIAAHFRSLAKFPDEATEQLSDEQYVRDVVQILYGSRAGAGQEAAGRASS